MTEYTRLPNETDEALILRICRDKSLIGSWDDVATVLNELLGANYRPNTYRNKFQSYDKFRQVDLDKSESSLLEEIKEQRRELEKEKIKLQTANIERRRMDRCEAKQEMYYQYVGTAIQSLPMPNFYPLYSDFENNIEYLVTLADVHYGATFKSENNEYSPDIAKDRFEYLSARIALFVQSHKLSKIHIVSLGDLVQGILRMSDLKINDSSVVKAVVEISRLIALFLNEISAYTTVEYYHSPTANHSQIRPLGTKASEIADEDLEYVIGNYIKDLCANNNRITIHLAEEGKQYIDIPIFDYNIIAMHGHQIKNIETSVKDMSMLKRRFIDYLILGHFHNGKEIPSSESCCYDTEVLVSPSFIGSDPYSDSIMKGAKASVKIYGFDDLYGHTETHKIILN